ncbi:MAG: GNAT family N-acetyltransferase [Alphaproteobacteria bacterium]|nr:GNAT family N-acetyltransferase [Alphaproteobacteria bacterium]
MAQWMPMLKNHINEVAALGDRIHTNYPESLESFRSKFTASPETCFVLLDEGICAGYALAHPAEYLNPPALNTILGQPSTNHDCLHIHDIVIDTPYRGAGLLNVLMSKLSAFKIHPKQTLIAVGGTAPVWTRYGFQEIKNPQSDAICRTYSTSALYMCR